MVKHVTCMFNIENVSYMKHGFAYLTGMLHACYNVLLNACWPEGNIRSIAHRYSFWTSWPQYIPTASPTMLKCFTSCKCSMHVIVSHVTSMFSVTCMENVPNPCMLHATCVYNILLDTHVTWPQVVTNKVHFTSRGYVGIADQQKQGNKVGMMV